MKLQLDKQLQNIKNLPTTELHEMLKTCDLCAVPLIKYELHTRQNNQSMRAREITP